MLKDVFIWQSTQYYFHQSGKTYWDADEMFKCNTEKFGVKSTYSPDMEGYTTRLVVDKNSDRYRSAERLAKEIQEKPSGADLDEREEEEWVFRLFNINTSVEAR